MVFFSGAVGNIYRQFALALAVSIAFSAFLALSLTPALCATLLKPMQKGHQEKTGFFGWFNRSLSLSTPTVMRPHWQNTKASFAVVYCLWPHRYYRSADVCEITYCIFTR